MQGSHPGHIRLLQILGNQDPAFLHPKTELKPQAPNNPTAVETLLPTLPPTLPPQKRQQH